MRKISFLLGVAIGFMLGSRAGRRPYEQMMTKVRETARRPEVQDAIVQAKDTAKDQAAAAAQKVGWTPHTSSDASTVATPEPYADPKDLQFGTAAARREELVDDLIKNGASPADLEQTEAEMRQAGMLDEPRAANKAQPINKG
jgi:hypothetical protein